MSDMTPAEMAEFQRHDLARAHALLIAVEERYAELERYRDWFATNPIGQGWADLAAENAIRLAEVRDLLTVARQGVVPEGEARVMAGHR